MAKMSPKTKSILHELTTYRASDKDLLDVFDTRAMHVIESAASLLSDMKDELSEEEADLLEKRFYSSVRNSDSSRFNRAIQKIKTNRESDDNE